MVPVLVLGFNRPLLLRRVLQRVYEANPDRLYVAIDGPRSANAGDLTAVLACQEVVESFDWVCEVRTQYRTENLGCGRAVSSAIDWFFEHEEQGMILEDDILPDPSFFHFISEMLEKDAHSDDVFAVSGCNFVPVNDLSETASYRYSRFPHIWGWGTWRRAWESYRFDLTSEDANTGLCDLSRSCSGSLAAIVHWSAIHALVARGRIDTWDYQFAFACMRAGARVATSNTNLVENIGFGADATHTVKRPEYLLSSGPIAFPLREPQLLIDTAADQWTLRHVFEATWLGFVRLAYRGVKASMS